MACLFSLFAESLHVRESVLILVVPQGILDDYMSLVCLIRRLNTGYLSDASIDVSCHRRYDAMRSPNAQIPLMQCKITDCRKVICAKLSENLTSDKFNFFTITISCALTLVSCVPQDCQFLPDIVLQKQGAVSTV